MMEFIQSFITLAMQHNLEVSVQYTPGINNNIANALSCF